MAQSFVGHCVINKLTLLFYSSGGIAVLWFILWIVLVSNTPATNRFITTEEKDYIESEMSKISDGEPVTVRLFASLL